MRRFILLLILAGCTVGPDYEAPSVELPDSYRNKLSDVGSQEKLWWSTFNDPELDILVNKAVDANKDIEVALSRVNQGRALVKLARAELLPGMQLSGNYTKSKSSAFGFPGGGRSFDFEIYAGSINASWEIDLFGRLRRQLESNRAGMERDIALLQDVMRIVLADVGEAYINYRNAEEQLRITKRNLETQRNSLELVKTKFDLGESSQLELLQAKSQYHQTRALIPALELVKETTRNQLALLLADPALEISDGHSIPVAKGLPELGSPEDILRARPDVRAAERALAAATASIGVAVGELYPKISISGAFGREAADISPLSLSTEVYRFGPTITFNPLDNGRLRAIVRQREAQTEEALYIWEKAVLKSLQEVEDALATYDAETRRFVDLELGFDAAREASEVSYEQYQEGLLDFLSVLDSQRTAIGAESNYADSKRTLALSVISLYRALGQGWQAGELIVDKNERDS